MSFTKLLLTPVVLEGKPFMNAGRKCCTKCTESAMNAVFKQTEWKSLYVLHSGITAASATAGQKHYLV